MQITDLRAFQVTGRADVPVIEERGARLLAWYPDVARAAGRPGGGSMTLTHTYLEVAADDGTTGLFGPLFEETAVVALKKLRPYLVGLDPLAWEKVWDVLYRQDRHARKGYEMMAISAVDNALWDLRGKVAGKPVYQLLGGPTRDRIDSYASMSGHSHEPEKVRDRARWAVEQGHAAQKWFFSLGPADGLAGLHRNVELVRNVRAGAGPDAEILLDAGRSWTATYAIRLLGLIEEFEPRWLEEPVQPDRLEDYAAIKQSTNIPIAHGEHEYTRWGFLQLLKADVIDVIQADPDWCGGISELVKICALASAFGRPVVPHGHSIHAAVHVIASQPPETCPMAEFLYKTQPMKQWFHTRYVEPASGVIALPTSPGLGIEIDAAKVERRTGLG